MFDRLLLTVKNEPCIMVIACAVTVCDVGHDRALEKAPKHVSHHEFLCMIIIDHLFLCVGLGAPGESVQTKDCRKCKSRRIRSADSEIFVNPRTCECMPLCFQMAIKVI